MSQTPGPWDISGPVTGDDVPVSHTETPENFGCVCICRGRDAATNEANARLICAAPALLASCERLAALAFALGAGIADEREVQAAFALNRAAINKAKGKE